MNLRERMKIDREIRHKARRKLRQKAGNSSPKRTVLMMERYKEKRAEAKKRIEKFRKQNLVKV